MRTIGIDPGLQVTGLATCDDGQIIDTRSIRGVSGAGNDYAQVAAAASRIAEAVRAYVRADVPDRIAIETFVDQGPERKRLPYRWHTPVVTGALVHALREWVDLIVWQGSREVLTTGPSGYGVVFHLARNGRLGNGLDRRVNEHEAAAVAHAMWAEAVARQERLFTQV